jgi:F-type H+-transporting ATPase subunit a
MSFSVRNTNKKGKLKIIICIFIIIFITNTLGLFPHIFTITAHMIFTLLLALPFWLGFIIFRITKNTSKFLRHLVPLRTPLPLSQFIVIIETTSQVIRPITLSVRLAANITAGHILLALCSRTTTAMRRRSLVLVLLLILEAAVAIIQRYVFTTLLVMYLRETYDKTISPLPYGIPKTLTPHNRNSHSQSPCGYNLYN